MSRKRQDTYAKVVLQHVIETTPELRRDPEILVMRNAVHHYLLGYGRRLQEMEKDAKLKEVTGGERFKTALERTRNAYSVLLGIREGLKTDRFVHLKF